MSGWRAFDQRYTPVVPGYLEQLLDYNSWATTRLLDFLASQPQELMEATSAGVYGSIGETLTHMLVAERSYVERLAGRRPPEDAEENLPLTELRVLAGTVGDSLRLLSRELPAPDLRFKRRRGWTTASTALVQLIQHGGEHRAQVATILGAHGIETPKLDGWAHGIATGVASLTD